MTTFTINLDSFGFTRAGHTFTVDPSRFNAEIVTQLVMHGATQKIGDAAAGKDGDEALAKMNEVYEALANGDWGRTRGGSAEPAINRFIREFVRLNLSDESKKAYADLKGDADARADFLWAKYEGASDEHRAAIDEGAAELHGAWKAEQDRRKKAAQKIAAKL